MKDISFKYPNKSNYVFESLNFKIDKHSCIGIIEDNGSGKSTFVDIILGILKPEKGKIFINGKENNDYNLINKKIGYLPQDHLIVSDTIKKNISLETEINKIDNHKLLSSIKSVNLNSLIDKLPDNLDTLIGKDGYRLSGGEVQKNSTSKIILS